MDILITGASGYIGNQIYQKLKKKHKLFQLTRQICDLSDSKQVDFFFKNKKFDVIIHCAATGGNQLINENYSVMDNNLQMYYNLLHHQDKFNKLIHLGSGSEFAKELTPYGLSKKVISKSIKDRKNFYDLKIFGIFDENELNRRFIKASLINYINKTPIIIHNNKQMDFFYLHDFFMVLDEYLIKDNPPKAINCVYDNKKSLLDIASFINNLGDHKVPIKIINETIIDNYTGEYNQFMTKFNFFGLENGIKTVYNKLIDIN